MEFEQLTGLGGLTGQSALWAGNVASPNEKRPGDCEFHSGRGIGWSGQEQPMGCILPDRVLELKSCSGRDKDSSGAASK